MFYKYFDTGALLASKSTIDVTYFNQFVFIRLIAYTMIFIHLKLEKYGITVKVTDVFRIYEFRAQFRGIKY